MKNNNPHWLVAIIASSHSFLSILFSILFSNRFQQIKDINKCFLFIFDYQWVSDLFYGIKPYVEKGGICNMLLVLAVIIILFLWEQDFVEVAINKICKIDVKYNIKRLYYPLCKYPHPKMNFFAIFKTIKINYSVNLIVVFFSYLNKDTPSFLVSILGVIGIFIFGAIYHECFKKWENLCFKRKSQ